MLTILVQFHDKFLVIYKMHILLFHFIYGMIYLWKKFKEEVIMALKRVTMQDIANSCGVSRNTVSKIFNGRGAVPEATRRRVLEKAEELGYRQILKDELPHTELQNRRVVLFTCRMPSDNHFGTLFLPAFANQLSRAGYMLMMYELSPEDLRECRLPEQMSLEQTAGILGIELFDRNYLKMLCNLGLPAFFVDAHAGASTSLPDYNIISMENFASTIALTEHVISAGAKRIGFVGDINHCNSFRERWMGFCFALGSAGLALDRQICILDNDGPQYGDTEWLLERLRGMPELPDALICANDFIAISIMTVLKQMGAAIPEDIMVTGFDGTPQSAIVEPSLTTVQIPGADFGRLAANMMLERIENPDFPYFFTYIKSTPIWRESTARKQ